MSDAVEIELAAEDAKLVTLAKSARARNQTAQAAAVRDQDGRTYVATTVNLPSLQLSALQTAVAMAVASGARSLEAAVILGESSEDPEGVAAAKELSVGVLFRADPAGHPISS